MNERIKELAVDAGFDEDDGHLLLHKVYVTSRLEKFAELIIKECLMLVWERQQMAPSDDDGYFKTALDMVSTDIEQHLGVEE